MSLTYEVANLRRAVDSARRTLFDAEYAEERERQIRRREAEAVLALVAERMRQVESVLRREADARTLLAHYNASPDTDDDVVLRCNVSR